MSSRDKKDEIILQQLEVIRSMTERNIRSMNSDFWGRPQDAVPEQGEKQEKKTAAAEKPEPEQAEEVQPPEKIEDLLDDLIAQSVALVGKPAALMNKEDKIKAIHFLNENGAFLVTRSGDKIAKYFGISKYTLYAYLDAAKSTED